VSLLLVFAGSFGSAALGGRVLAFDDHPGQLFRFYHLLRRGPAPWAWNPDWWGGVPELQFYPPGYFYLAALPVWLTGGLLPPIVAWQALAWLTWLAPGLTTFALLARVAGSTWHALPGAMVALTLSADLASGVEGGLRTGMLPARLGWACLPALGCVLRRGLTDRAVALGAALLAVTVLLHPAHGPAAMALVVVVAAARDRGPGRRRVGRALLLVGLAACLSAFWTLPLLVRLEHAHALAWGTWAPWATLRRHPLLGVLAVLAVTAPGLARTSEERRLVAWPWVAWAAVALDALVTAALGAPWLPPDRAADGAWLATVIAAGLCMARGLQALEHRLGAPGWSTAPALTAVLMAVGVTWGPALARWPSPEAWPSLTLLERGLRLPALWDVLRQAPSGRVLFVRSGVPLAYGDAWWRPHSHVTALAPVYTGRPIIHGTFTHFAPTATVVYGGTLGRRPVTRLAEQLDGHQLFGTPLEDLTFERLRPYLERLGASVLVAVDEDLPRLARLEAHPEIRRLASPGPFVVYAWVGTRRPPEPVPGTTDRWRFVPDAPAGAWTTARVSYYPLWQAWQRGQPLERRRGPLGDLEVRLRSAADPVDLRYGPGGPERLGVLLSAIGLSLWGVGLGRASRHPPRPAPLTPPGACGSRAPAPPRPRSGP
jgi:hypothetical protein